MFFILYLQLSVKMRSNSMRINFNNYFDKQQVSLMPL